VKILMSSSSAHWFWRGCIRCSAERAGTNSPAGFRRCSTTAAKERTAKRENQTDRR
jgi:hypothetical protein